MTTPSRRFVRPSPALPSAGKAARPSGRIRGSTASRTCVTRTGSPGRTTWASAPSTSNSDGMRSEGNVASSQAMRQAYRGGDAKTPPPRFDRLLDRDLRVHHPHVDPLAAPVDPRPEIDPQRDAVEDEHVPDRPSMQVVVDPVDGVGQPLVDGEAEQDEEASRRHRDERDAGDLVPRD